ncbi:hypothetical protein [Streptomyces sp. NPDC005485]
MTGEIIPADAVADADADAEEAEIARDVTRVLRGTMGSGRNGELGLA